MKVRSYSFNQHNTLVAPVAVGQDIIRIPEGVGEDIRIWRSIIGALGGPARVRSRNFWAISRWPSAEVRKYSAGGRTHQSLFSFPAAGVIHGGEKIHLA